MPINRRKHGLDLSLAAQLDGDHALSSEEEDRKIVEAALADPDAQPVTDEQLAQMAPIQQLPELLKKNSAKRAPDSDGAAISCAQARAGGNPLM